MVQKIGRLIELSLADTRLRYLVAGGVNTVFGYGVSVLLYSLLHQRLHIVLIGIIINIVTITFSFLTYKLFVFKTKEGWLREYLRCYVIYGTSLVVGICLLWLLVDFFTIRFWIAQGMLLCGTVCISYLGHSRYSFKQ